jgi:GTP-binding protein HflX
LRPSTQLPGALICRAIIFVSSPIPSAFIQKLPTQLIAAFHSTLEEITEADLLLHIIDISHPNALAQFESVRETLKEIGAENIPILNVFNKADLLEDPEEAKNLLSETDPNAYLISAKTGQGIED